MYVNYTAIPDHCAATGLWDNDFFLNISLVKWSLKSVIPSKWLSPAVTGNITTDSMSMQNQTNPE